jgi:hypothetical protein
MSKQIFRFIPDIEELEEHQLLVHGYYKGFPCAHGHTIRDVTGHWCYHCVRKIQNNICGLDVNYMHRHYKVRYETLWGLMPTGELTECWEKEFQQDRISFPSYRSLKSKRFSENVSIHKAVYQSAWGDVGKGWVTRTCKNPNCFNPLHMRSVWNPPNPPKTIAPFTTKFQYQKLMLAGRREAENLPTDELVVRQFKMPITHAKFQKAPQELAE